MSHSRIMIVEDEALVAADIEHRLQNLGYEVAAIVDTGEDAVALAADAEPDLALMDIRLKGRMSGIEAADILRVRHQIPVVYLTSHADSDTLARAGSTEPFGYIIKPFQEHDLHATIEMAFYRARAEARLRKMERWLSTTLDSIADAVIATDTGGRVSFLNKMAENLTGWPCADALGRDFHEVLDAREEADQAVARQLVSGAVERGAVYRHDRTLRLHARDGRETPVDDSAAPIRDAAGNVIGVVLLFRDRTEQEQMLEQRRRLEHKMREAQKLESLGVLAGGIAHDFNNLLTGIVGNTSLALHMLPSTSGARACLDDVRLASQRAAELIRQLLAYSGRGRLETERVELSGLVKETSRLIGLSVNKKARVSLQLAEGLPSVMADPAQIRQVVMNLVINASEAIGDQPGEIEIATRSVRAHRTMLDATITGVGLPEGHYVALEVRDTGRGISPENLERIFDPFFTTKFTGRGLGLAAVIGIVRSHKGALNVQSEIGRGTTFHMWLPAITAQESAGSEKGRARETPLGAATSFGSGTVLIVDDEPFVRSTAGLILKAHGFEVVEAADGPTGVARHAADPKRYRIVLLDLSMPGLDGLQAFKEIRRADPEARVVLTSGFGEQEAVAKFSEERLSGFLQKPFDAETLLAVIKSALA